MRIETIYNIRRHLVDFEEGTEVYFKLVKGTKDRYKIFDNFIKLSFINKGPFKIRYKINSFIYKLKLSD
jgi:hypothetical protein